MPLLEVQSITKYFGGLRALYDVAFFVQKGELVSIVGPNGSGKTTLFNVITGFHKPTKGIVTFEGNPIGGLGPHIISRAGIGRTFQVTAVFENLRVLENVIIGLHRRTSSKMVSALIRTRSYRKEERDCLEKAKETLDFVGLGSCAYDFAGQLPSFFRKRLAIAIALVSNPRLLLLDEPASGLNWEEVSSLASLLKNILKTGVTICVIEHKMKFVMALSDRIIVLNQGQKIAEGTPSGVSEDEKVVAAYLGR